MVYNKFPPKLISKCFCIIKILHTHKHLILSLFKSFHNRMGWHIIYSKKTCLHGHQKTSLSLIWQLIIYAVNSNSVHTWVNLPSNIAEGKFKTRKASMERGKRNKQKFLAICINTSYTYYIKPIGDSFAFHILWVFVFVWRVFQQSTFLFRM